MQFSYDSFGRMQTMTFPNWIQNDWKNVSGNGELVSYFYDRGGNIDKITGYQQTQNPQHPEFPRNFAYLNHMGYDEFEQRRIMTSGNGIVNKYGYDPLTRRLLTVDAASKGAQERQLGKDATPFHAMHYYHDLVGNITKVENATTVYTWQNASVRTGPMRMQYTYDNLYQLTSATGKYRPDRGYGYDYTSTFQYDETSNLKKKAQLERRLVWDNQNPPAGLAALDGERFDHTVSNYSYTLDYNYTGTRPHAANKITETSSTGSANDHVVNYDANGNNTGNVYMGSTRTMTWDEENRLKEVKDATVSRGKFLYSPDGERTHRQTAAGDAFYVNQFFVLQPSGILPTKHIFAGETRIVTKTDPISQVAAISYYHPDHLGSTSYTSAGDQTLLQHERYFPFGERDTGDQEECDLGRPDNMRRGWLFNSKELDFDTGLYYFGARYYDPKTSVWQSADPIFGQYMSKGGKGVSSPQNLALYSYAWNNPLTNKDPNGAICQETGSSNACGGGHSDAQALVARIDSTLAQVDRRVAEIDYDWKVSLAQYDLANRPNDNSVWATGPANLAPAMRGKDTSWLPMLQTELAVGIVGGLSSGLFEEGAARAPAAAYEVGIARDLAERSVGDAMQVHHVGQAHALKQLIPGYSRANAPAIVLPNAEHFAIPNTTD